MSCLFAPFGYRELLAVPGTAAGVDDGSWPALARSDEPPLRSAHSRGAGHHSRTAVVADVSNLAAIVGGLRFPRLKPRNPLNNGLDQ